MAAGAERGRPLQTRPQNGRGGRCSTDMVAKTIMTDVAVVATARMAMGYAIADETAGSGERGALPRDGRGARYCRRGHRGMGGVVVNKAMGRRGRRPWTWTWLRPPGRKGL